MKLSLLINVMTIYDYFFPTLNFILQKHMMVTADIAQVVQEFLLSRKL